MTSGDLVFTRRFCLYNRPNAPSTPLETRTTEMVTTTGCDPKTSVTVVLHSLRYPNQRPSGISIQPQPPIARFSSVPPTSYKPPADNHAPTSPVSVTSHTSSNKGARYLLTKADRSVLVTVVSFAAISICSRIIGFSSVFLLLFCTAWVLIVNPYAPDSESEMSRKNGCDGVELTIIICEANVDSAESVATDLTGSTNRTATPLHGPFDTPMEGAQDALSVASEGPVRSDLGDRSLEDFADMGIEIEVDGDSAIEEPMCERGPDCGCEGCSDDFTEMNGSE